MHFPEVGNLPPLLFHPVYQRRLWGGTLLATALKRQLPETAPNQEPIGEAWELVDRADAQSVVASGVLAGATLAELREHYGAALCGGDADFQRFPILVKLIDAGERLSLQVHPDENYCRAHAADGGEPKTELWYVMAATPEGEILAGLHLRATRCALIDALNSPAVVNLMQRYRSIVGDSYFITSGTLHAIGAGNLILEIQQNSDTTFRVSDWGRVGRDGKPRALHVAPGLAATDFTNRKSPRIPAPVGAIVRNRKIPLAMRRHLNITALELTAPWMEDTGGIAGSCHVLSVADGTVTLEVPGHANWTLTLERGRTALVPAAVGAYTLTPTDAAAARVLRTTL